ncbi:MAG TPA: ABC transporter permease [Blastocatellia bacterium]|nr:ABC transporter permease [Blastocatellia bacterium]HNG31955.1 ABC transporter permease [Blastocatellia bacterium]
MFDNVFAPQSPEDNADRTLYVMAMRFSGPQNRSTGPAGYVFLDRYVRTLPNVERVSLYTTQNTVYSFWKGGKIESFLKRTDGQFWQIMNFRFLEGGPFTAEDEKSANFVAVINEATRRKFFGDEPAVGKMIEADGQQFRVVGVTANVSIFRMNSFSDIWVPISTSKTNAYKSQLLNGEFQAAILAKSAADFSAIKSEFQSRLPGVEFPDKREFDTAIGGADTMFEFASRMMIPSQQMESQPRKLLVVILSLMVLFMILPTVNLININVSRILERAGEIGVRKAFGASSWTLVGQFVTENILLTLIGGVIGFVGSQFVLKLIADSGLIPYAEFHLNHRFFIYGLLTALFFGLFSGVYPAWKMSRLHPVQALKGTTK